MKAILCKTYGSPDVLQLQEVEKPAPTDHQVLVQVHAASVNTLDLSLRGPFLARILSGGLRKPQDPRVGVDLAGRVEAVGSKVTQFQVGDEVFGRGRGAFAEYACAREDALVMKPTALPFGVAAAVPVAALTALQGLRDHGQIRAGQQVLIQGATGGVGTFAVQIAKAFGAEVTAVCSSRSVEMVRSLGADHVIDYTKEDVIRTGQRYDLILAVNGYHSVFGYRRILTPKGRYVMAGASRAHLYQALFQAIVLGPLLSRKEGQHLGFFLAKPTQQDLVVIKELLEVGKIVPVIDRQYPLAETAEALRYLEAGHAQSKVVITMEWYH